MQNQWFMCCIYRKLFLSILPILGTDKELSGIDAVIIWENIMIAKRVVTSEMKRIYKIKFI